MEIEAVATPVESIDDDVEDLELGSDDDGSVSTEVNGIVTVTMTVAVTVTVAVAVTGTA